MQSDTVRAYAGADFIQISQRSRFFKSCIAWEDSEAVAGRQSKKDGNMRDEANLNLLLVIANMESYKAILIEQNGKMSERMILLREVAVLQMKMLIAVSMDE